MIVFKLCFHLLKLKKILKLIKISKNIQKIFDIDLNDYKNFSKIFNKENLSFKQIEKFFSNKSNIKKKEIYISYLITKFYEKNNEIFELKFDESFEDIIKRNIFPYYSVKIIFHYFFHNLNKLKQINKNKIKELKISEEIYNIFNPNEKEDENIEEEEKMNIEEILINLLQGNNLEKLTIPILDNLINKISNKNIKILKIFIIDFSSDIFSKKFFDNITNLTIMWPKYLCETNDDIAEKMNDSYNCFDKKCLKNLKIFHVDLGGNIILYKTLLENLEELIYESNIEFEENINFKELKLRKLEINNWECYKFPFFIFELMNLNVLKLTIEDLKFDYDYSKEIN